MLTVLSREYCHLCHDMIEALRQVQAARPYCFTGLLKNYCACQYGVAKDLKMLMYTPIHSAFSAALSLVLAALATFFNKPLQVIDIDSERALEEKYSELVPVLLAGEQEICHYHLDHAALNAYLTGFR